MLDLMAKIFFYGILAAPFISYFIVRKTSLDRGEKSALFFLITVILVVVFFSIAVKIHFRNGLA